MKQVRYLDIQSESQQIMHDNLKPNRTSLGRRQYLHQMRPEKEDLAQQADTEEEPHKWTAHQLDHELSQKLANMDIEPVNDHAQMKTDWSTNVQVAHLQQLLVELRCRHRDQLQQVEDRNEQLQSELLTLNESYSECRAQLVRLQQAATRQEQHQQLQYNIRVKQLTAECRRLQRSQLSGQRQLAEQLVPVQREKAALSQRLHSAESELSSCRKQVESVHEQLTLQLNNSRRQLSEITAQLKSAQLDNTRLTSRNQLLELRVQQLQQEQLDISRRQQTEASSRSQLQQQLADHKYQYKQQLTNAQCQIERQAGDFDRERAFTDRRVQHLQKQVALKEAHVHQLKTALTAAETRAHRVGEQLATAERGESEVYRRLEHIEHTLYQRDAYSVCECRKQRARVLVGERSDMVDGNITPIEPRSRPTEYLNTQNVDTERVEGEQEQQQQETHDDTPGVHKSPTSSPESAVAELVDKQSQHTAADDDNSDDGASMIDKENYTQLRRSHRQLLAKHHRFTTLLMSTHMPDKPPSHQQHSLPNE